MPERVLGRARGRGSSHARLEAEGIGDASEDGLAVLREGAKRVPLREPAPCRPPGRVESVSTHRLSDAYTTCVVLRDGNALMPSAVTGEPAGVCPGAGRVPERTGQTVIPVTTPWDSGLPGSQRHRTRKRPHRVMPLTGQSGEVPSGEDQ